MKKIIIIFIILILIALMVGGVSLKPKYELNKAIEYIKNGEYSKACTYISDKRDENNIKVVKELISVELITKMNGGLEQIATIANKATEIIRKTDFNNIDYSLDDSLNIYVEKLEDYIKLKDIIPKDILIADNKVYETYDLYFEVLEFINSNFTNILNHINENDIDVNEINQLSLKLETISINIKSIVDNYNFDMKTHQIYGEILDNYKTINDKI